MTKEEKKDTEAKEAEEEKAPAPKKEAKAESGTRKKGKGKGKRKGASSKKSSSKDKSSKEPSSSEKKASSEKEESSSKPAKAARAATSDPPPAKAADEGHAKKHAPAHAHGHHKPDRKEYVKIWVWLAVLTALEVGIAYLEDTVGKTALIVALVGLALAKAACVALFFMHLKHETRIMRWTVAFPMMFPALYAFVLIAEGIYRSLWGGS